MSSPRSQPPPDPEAFYAASYDRLVRVLTLVAGSRADAEDAVQDAFVRLIPRWTTIARYDDPEAWVRLVAFRLLTSRLRRAGRQLTLLARQRRDTAASPPSSDHLDVARALAALPLEQRHVVVLHHLLDLPVERVAAELRVPVGTVKSRLARARAALAPRLREEVPHD